MKLTVIASGSSGNMVYIMGKDSNILIDAGLSYKQTNLRLNQIGIDKVEANALFITHEHGDHVGNLTSILGKMDIPFYISEESFLNLSSKVYDNVKNKEHYFISPMQKVKIGSLEVEAIELSHDSKSCLGYIIRENNKQIVYVADTGYLNMDYNKILYGADCYLFEANHDPELQMASNRDFRLKQRVLGIKGHLSNEDSAVALSYLISEKTKNIVFIHRSKECNTLDKLKETVFSIFEEYSIDTAKINFNYAEQDYPTNVIEV